MDKEIYSSSQLIDFILEIGFLPLLNSGINGFCAELIVSPDCRYTQFEDGGWDWPLWKWKGDIIRSGNIVYGKFFNKKAGFISLNFWPEFCNYRRSKNVNLSNDAVEQTILEIVQFNGAMLVADIRKQCGFGGEKMRHTFDSYISKLQQRCLLVTEDFVYKKDRHGRDYGWGSAVVNTPEKLYGKENCISNNSPSKSFEIMANHLKDKFPQFTMQQISKLLG